MRFNAMRGSSNLGSGIVAGSVPRSEEHTSELQSRLHLVCRLLLEKKKNTVRHTLCGVNVNQRNADKLNVDCWILEEHSDITQPSLLSVPLHCTRPNIAHVQSAVH